MGKYTQLETECTGVLAQLRRKELATESGVLSVRLILKAQGKHETMYISGNWTATGSYVDVQGYEEVPMTRSEDGLHWEYELKLKPSDDFPTLHWQVLKAICVTNRQSLWRNFWWSRQNRMLCYQLSSPISTRPHFALHQNVGPVKMAANAYWLFGQMRVLGSWRMPMFGEVSCQTSLRLSSAGLDRYDFDPPTFYINRLHAHGRGKLWGVGRREPVLGDGCCPAQGDPILDWMVPDHWVSAESDGGLSSM